MTQQTRDRILTEGVRVAERTGLRSLSRNEVARGVGITPTAIIFYYKNLAMLRDAVLAHALKICSPQVVAEAILAGQNVKAPQVLCQHICDTIMAAADEVSV